MRILEHNSRLAALIAVMLWACSASGQTLTLLTKVDLTTETVRLSDLLPSGAPDDLRHLAQEVELGHAPKLGSMRVYQGSWIAEIISQHPELSKRITVPDQVVVRRAGFPVSRATVHDVVVHYLREKGEADLPDFALQWSGDVSTAGDHPSLEVRAVTWDSTRRQLQFRLRCLRDETCGDFLVYWQNPPAALVQRVKEFGWSQSAATGAIKTLGNGPVLIEPGRRVRLLMQGDGIQISLSVICLERGRAGQKIRVRTAGSAHVFQAEVVNRDLLWSRPES